MAVCEMKRISLAVYIRDLGKMINDLIWLGAVEITPCEINLADKNSEWNGIVARAEDIEDKQDAESLVKIDEQLQNFLSAINFLEPYDKSQNNFFKKILKFFVAKNYLSRNDIDIDFDSVLNIAGISNISVENDYGKALEITSEANKMITQVRELNEEKKRFELLKMLYMPWSELDIPMSMSSTERSIITLGVIPLLSSHNNISEILSKTAKNLNQTAFTDITLVSSDKQNIYVALIYHADDKDLVEENLHLYGISRINFSDVHITAKEKIAEIEMKIKQIDNALGDIKVKASDMADKLGMLKKYYDINLAKKTELQTKQKFLRTKSSAIAEGYILADKADALNAIAEKYSCCIEMQDPALGVRLKRKIFSGRIYENSGKAFSPVELSLKYNRVMLKKQKKKNRVCNN